MQWARFRKLPVVIEARRAAPEGETIKTLEGVMHASPGDWIIRGVNGELYPCKPDIFAKTYEPANPAATAQTTSHAAPAEKVSG